MLCQAGCEGGVVQYPGGEHVWRGEAIENWNLIAIHQPALAIFSFALALAHFAWVAELLTLN